MKTTFWFTCMLLMATLSVHTQDNNRKIVDDRFDKEILIGYCDRSGLQDGEFGESYDHEYQEYEPEKKFLKKIIKHDTDYDIVLVLATWCHDSKEQVPRFYKILDDAEIKEDLMKVICVDGQKTGGDVAIDNLNIERVPTFIFYRQGKEIGRIIETPENTLESDFYSIIK